MKLTVSILHLARMDKLVRENEFLKKVLKQDPYGGWWVETQRPEHLKEIERLMLANGIKGGFKL